MRQVCVALAVMFAGALAGGCGGETYPNLGPAREVITKSIDSIGGLKDWQKVKTVQAVAIVTSYDNAGAALVDRLDLTMDFAAGTIQAAGRATTGSWTAKADIGGAFGSEGPAPAAMVSCLPTILHRCEGPLNFLHTDKALNIRRARVNGADVDRVGATGPNGARLAYYFDTVTGLLRFLSAGDDTAGGRGTVTIYGRESYVMLPSGLVFPHKFRIVKLGRDTLVGETPVLEVEFTDIKAK
ncbi:MAG: hypothetical protein ACE15C_10130 [Phycisphaerae bacterium]